MICLNYDALLDAALINATGGFARYSKQVSLTDEFNGMDVGIIPLYRPDRSIEEVEAFRVAPYYPRYEHLRLHHLHGAATWMRYNGAIWKAKHLGRLRECELFASWAEGVERPGPHDAVEPVVLLGDQKESSVNRWPFNESIRGVRHRGRSGRRNCPRGVVFHDRPLTRTIVQHRQRDARVVVINPSNDIEARAREALAIGKSDPLVVIHEPLPDGILELKA